jgi:hypothetical protein
MADGTLPRKEKSGYRDMIINRIAEICAELAPYRVMIAIDELLEYYTTEAALKGVEASLAQLLHSMKIVNDLNR